MKIEKLFLQNFRCFDSFEIDFHAELTVIIGANGSGKTALLEALVVSFGTYLGCFDEGKGDGFEPTDARRTRLTAALANTEPQYPVQLEAWGSWQDTHETWRRELGSKKFRTTSKDATKLTLYGKELATSARKDPSISLPMLGYYGTGRLWKNTRLSTQKNQYYRRRELRVTEIACAAHLTTGSLPTGSSRRFSPNWRNTSIGRTVKPTRQG